MTENNREVSDTIEPTPEPQLETEAHYKITKANAAEKGRRGGKKSAAVRAKKPTLEELKQRGPEVLKDLLDAAKGQGAWGKLDAKDRLSALKAALPYVLGRPGPMNSGAGEDEPEVGADLIITQAPEKPTDE